MAGYRKVRRGSSWSVVGPDGEVHGSSLTEGEADRVVRMLEGGGARGLGASRGLNVPHGYEDE